MKSLYLLKRKKAKDSVLLVKMYGPSYFSHHIVVTGNLYMGNAIDHSVCLILATQKTGRCFGLSFLRQLPCLTKQGRSKQIYTENGWKRQMKTSFSALARLRRLSAICRSFDHESDSLLTRISDETQLKSHTSRIMTVNILQDKIAQMILIFTIVLVIYSMVIPCICDSCN